MAKWALIVGDVVHQLDAEDPTDRYAPDLVWMPAGDEVEVGWILADGALVAPEVPQPTLAELIAAGRALVSAHVETVARSRNYDSAVSCTSYERSTDPGWAAEAQAFIAWRDAVWAQAIALWAAVEAGTATAPSAEALIASLPVIEWPTA